MTTDEEFRMQAGILRISVLQVNVKVNILFEECTCNFLCLQCFDAVGWGGRKGIRPVKN